MERLLNWWQLWWNLFKMDVLEFNQAKVREDSIPSKIKLFHFFLLSLSYNLNPTEVRVSFATWTMLWGRWGWTAVHTVMSWPSIAWWLRTVSPLPCWWLSSSHFVDSHIIFSNPKPSETLGAFHFCFEQTKESLFFFSSQFSIFGNDNSLRWKSKRRLSPLQRGLEGD